VRRAFFCACGVNRAFALLFLRISVRLFLGIIIIHKLGGILLGLGGGSGRLIVVLSVG
jgi:hypothetical protein